MLSDKDRDLALDSHAAFRTTLLWSMPSQTTVWAQSMLGQTLKGRYRLSGILGEGAMGVVFSGVNLAMDKAVAIKMMRKETFDTPDAVERFNREARVWSQLNHPVITQVFDFGVQEGQPFLVMELVEGADLSEVLRRERLLDPLRAVRLMRQLAAALEEAHRLGVVHRDIKPQNMKLLRYQPGGKMILKVLDFGMAKQVGKADQRLTAPGILVGTPKYVAPEQITENPLIDGRTDLYASGVLFYELLTGAAPFLGSPHEVLFAHLGTEPAPLPEWVPSMVRDVVMRLLRKRPDDRFPNAALLEQALEECEMALRSPSLPSYVSGGYATHSGEVNVAAVKPSALSAPPSAQSLRNHPAQAAMPAGTPIAATPLSPSARSVTAPPAARSAAPLPSQQSLRSQQPAGTPPMGVSPLVPPSQQSQRSQQSGPNQPSMRSQNSGPSQTTSSQTSRPPARGFSRTLLGSVFVVTMLGSSALFYGLRHYLPLQRSVASWLPSFKVPQDEEVQLTLRAMEAQRERRQWAAVLRGVQFLDQRYGDTLLPEQTTTLRGLRQKALFETPLEEIFDKLVAAATRPDPEDVVRLHGQLPSESVYYALAQPYYNTAVESYVATHLSKAEALRLASRCAEYLTEVQKLLNVVPGHSQASAAERKPCPPADFETAAPSATETVLPAPNGR